MYSPSAELSSNIASTSSIHSAKQADLREIYMWAYTVNSGIPRHLFIDSAKLDNLLKLPQGAFSVEVSA